MYLDQFQKIRPPYESLQEETLEWLIDAHTEAEKRQGKSDVEIDLFRKEIHERLHHVGCKPHQIAKRGHILPDFLHRDWSSMSVYQLDRTASGAVLDTRMQVFKEYADQILDQFYQECTQPPDDLIHVTCTGYASPSCAQKLVSQKGWGESTVVTHAYHMGCYGAFSALRIARGFLQSQEKTTADIIHTEICSLHSNPSLHQLDQLVSQSLFADGFIKYTMKKEPSAKCFHILAIREEIIPDSLHAMSWDVAHWGHQMSLSKEVPVLITRALKAYLERLAAASSWSPSELSKHAYFAIHPGGPKILVHLQKILEASDNQLKHTTQVLSNYGNMSSATLPHVWESLLDDEEVPDGAPVVSLAFGPGLSICGAILEKRCGG